MYFRINNFPIVCLFLLMLCIFYEANAETKYIDIHSYLYLNASHAGFHGDRYLLNRQLSSIQLSLDWQIKPYSKLHAMFVYNPWPVSIYPVFYFDELYNQFQWHPSLYIKLGRQWIPFGNYRSDLIYKPFTKALGQTNEDTILLGYDKFRIYTNVSIFKPHTEIQNINFPANYNLNIGTKVDAYDMGLSYISSIAETQIFRYNKGFGGFEGETIKSHTPGMAHYINLIYKTMNLNLTYLFALKKFYNSDLSFDGSGARPGALSLQSGYKFHINKTPAKIIGFYDISFESLALQIPKKRAGIGFNLYPFKYIDVSFQCFKDYAYAKNTYASGLNQRVKSDGKIYDTLAVQILIHI